ncbi:MAG: hypothetical protein QOF17_666 [Solirubrobacteraceae bacterium]|jgi:hypothetical protein|nr:hypothetical protein [Solirubrobacteraceae bacterium]
MLARVLPRAAWLTGVLVALAAPSAARADIAVTGFTLIPADNRAGNQTRIDLHADFSTADPLRALVVHLPPGLVGNPLAVPRCPQSRFRDSTCPRETRVGTASVSTTLPLAGSASGSVFNLEPGPGEPARLGVEVAPPAPLTATKLMVRVALRADGGIDTAIDDIPSSLGAVRSVDLSLGGAYAPPFITLPTSCGPATTTIEAVAASGARGGASSAFTPLQCERLPFAPELSASMNRRGPAGARHNPALSTQLVVPPGSAAIRRLGVTLPDRMGLDFSRRLAVCTVEQARADACPDATRIGSAAAVTPVLVAPLAGPIHMAAVEGSLLPALRLSLGGAVQLRFQATTDVTTGVTTAFDGLPDLPLDRMALTFAAAGPLRVLGDPCTGTRLRMTMTATGHNGATVAVPAPVRIRGCPIVVTGRRARGGLRLKVHRGRDAAKLRRVTVRVRHRTIRVRPARPRAGVTVRLRGRPRGSLRVSAIGTDGRRSTVRVKLAALR